MANLGTVTLTLSDKDLTIICAVLEDAALVTLGERPIEDPEAMPPREREKFLRTRHRDARRALVLARKWFDAFLAPLDPSRRDG